MKETRFIDQRKAQWQELEDALANGSKDPNQLSDLYIQVTDDLSYARTFYGNRVVRVYLNQLTQRLFRSLFRNTAQHKKRLKTFLVEELPASIYLSRRSLITALVVFAVAVAIGVFSSMHDPSFPRSILGDTYVNMTDKNIESGDPMAVYKDADVLNMFLQIATNNLLVAFKAFIFGLLFALGSLGILLYNGIMVGAFQYYFISKGVAVESILTIWMHGTMEISAIVISGGAGLVMGSGLVFPGTYTRLQSLRMSARAGIRIMAAVTPIIITAALIEAVVTRYTSVGDGIRAILIVLQAAFMLFYFVVLPWKIRRKAANIRLDEDRLPVPKPIEQELKDLPLGNDIFSATFRLYFHALPGILKKIALPCFLAAAYFLIQLDPDVRIGLGNSSPFFISKLHSILDYQNNFINVAITTIFASWIVTQASKSWRSNPVFIPEWSKAIPTDNKTMAVIFIGNCVIIGLPTSIMTIGSDISYTLFYISMFLVLPWLAAWNISNENFIQTSLSFVTRYFSTIGMYIFSVFSLAFPALMILLLSDMLLPLINVEVLEWNFRIDDESYTWIKSGLAVITTMIGSVLVLIMLLFGMMMANYAAIERLEAPGLRMRLSKFNLINSKK
jgi:uncharacterized membrane protein SpoIIM required for sporulation